jgi:ribosomal protein S18 acetylase RimI-like enzyme
VHDNIGGSANGSDAGLDNMVWASLVGPHRRFAQRYGRAARFEPSVSQFAALADPADPAAWRDLATLTGPGGTAMLEGHGVHPPDGWVCVGQILGARLVDVAVRKVVDPEAVRLGAGDLPEVLDLVRRGELGPFGPRTIELGSYLGIRRGGALVAMAGERMRVPGWTEISAVCTDPAYRGQGLATRLVATIAAGISSRGERAMLHVTGTNGAAVRLYLSMGFELRRRTVVHRVRAPLTPFIPRQSPRQELLNRCSTNQSRAAEDVTAKPGPV